MNIFQSINTIMSEIVPIAKDKKTGGDSFSFKYRGIDQVMNALQPILAKNKVFIVPRVLEQTRERIVTSGSGKEKQTQYSVLKIEYIFYAEDGSSVSVITIGEGMDNGDKASNKAMSIAFKYACFQVFCIPTEEMPDPDAEVHNAIESKKPQEPKQREEPSKPEESVQAEIFKCECCGNEMAERKYKLCQQKYNVAVCSSECLKKLGLNPRV